MTLTEFLLARIAEDEARVEGFFDGGSADPDFFWGPDRIRVECAAKRAVVELHSDNGSFGWCRECDGHPPCDTLRILALPYADHPEFREEWRP